MTPPQVIDGKRRNRNRLRRQLAERRLEANQVVGLGQRGNVNVAAKLGCAVENAGPPPQQQVAHLVAAE